MNITVGPDLSEIEKDITAKLKKHEEKNQTKNHRRDIINTVSTDKHDTGPMPTMEELEAGAIKL